MKYLWSATLSTGVLFFSSLAIGDPDYSKETIQSTQITSSIYLLKGAGGNMTVLLGQDGVFLVDDDFEEMSEKLVAKLFELRGSKPKYIVNTHFHYDHTGGNSVFGPTATIFAAAELRERLMHEQILWNKKHPPAPQHALPTVIIDKTLSLYLNQEHLILMHLPQGHTDGDTVVFFEKSKVVSMGDLYFSGMYPIFHPEHNGSLEGLVQNVKTVLSKISDDYKIIPGHGPVSTKAELRTYLDMIQSSIATVKKGISKGESLEKIQKLGLESKWEPFSHGYLSTERWIALIYKSLSQKIDDAD